MTMDEEKSFAQLEMERLSHGLGPLAHQALDVMLDKLSFEEVLALAYDWRHTWARPKQIPPHGWPWMSWGFLGGRGLGKTIAVSKHVNEEVEAGRASLIGLAAQDEANCIAVQVLGPSGLIATAPAWFKPAWEASSLQLVWPNGARAYVRTPEVPGKIRGLEYHLSWICELQSWPTKTRDEAYANFVLSTRLGYARIVWDATPKKRHPILRRLLENGERDPARHVVVRGSTRENAANLGTGYLEKLDEEMGGTQRGREEIEGEMLDDSESALVKQEWIDKNRCNMPSKLLRRVLGVDPAVTDHAGSDQTGIVDVGLMEDGRAIVLGDETGKHSPPGWGKIVLDRYRDGDCDLIIVETNKGGALLTQNLRACAEKRDLAVVVVDDKWRPQRVVGVVFVREVYGRGSKADRALPLATALRTEPSCARAHLGPRGPRGYAHDVGTIGWAEVTGPARPTRLRGRGAPRLLRGETGPKSSIPRHRSGSKGPDDARYTLLGVDRDRPRVWRSDLGEVFVEKYADPRKFWRHDPGDESERGSQREWLEGDGGGSEHPWNAAGGGSDRGVR